MEALKQLLQELGITITTPDYFTEYYEKSIKACAELIRRIEVNMPNYQGTEIVNEEIKFTHSVEIEIDINGTEETVLLTPAMMNKVANVYIEKGWNALPSWSAGGQVSLRLSKPAS